MTGDPCCVEEREIGRGRLRPDRDQEAWYEEGVHGHELGWVSRQPIVHEFHSHFRVSR